MNARAQLTLFHAPRAAAADFDATCFDCGVDTIEADEFYMVHDDVWLAACPWNTAGGMFDFLCFGCLETRIGRELDARDFTDARINSDEHGYSPRLAARIARAPGGGGRS